MTEPLPFEDETFDRSSPRIELLRGKVEPVFLECYRVLKRGGILLGGFDNGINYIVDNKEERIIHSLPFNHLKMKPCFANRSKSVSASSSHIRSKNRSAAQLKPISPDRSMKTRTA